MSGLAYVRTRAAVPRIPLRGSLDLTYRCNNRCRHCWLWLPSDAPEGLEELSFGEIRRIVDEGRALGCRQWALSGGEPMLRPDFPDILDYITRAASRYSLNTNGTLITPAIAHLLKRRGSKMVALYGATAAVHDHITRNPGSFEAAMQGFAYLREAGAGFIVQLIPMRDNYHQWKEMHALAQSLSSHYRVGASWLYLSACGSEARNREIRAQRLDPATVAALDPPAPSPEESQPGDAEREGCQGILGDERLFAGCSAIQHSFHIDPYGRMSSCCFVKDPALRYDLRQGTFQEAWDTFIPSLADRVLGGREYLENCGSCERRADCHWCAVYGYLEHGRFSAKVEYLCEMAQETRRMKEEWNQQHRRFYRIGGITVQLDADLPISDRTFSTAIERFHVPGPGDDTIYLRHHFDIPDLARLDLGPALYHKPPWAIYHYKGSWVYKSLGPEPGDDSISIIGVFSGDYRRGRIYYHRPQVFQDGGLTSLTLFPTDQILWAQLLSERQGCLLHAAGMILREQGLLFVGHSEAGKSTTVTMLRDEGQILCDDRIIVRRLAEGFRIYGTWSHGDIPDVSPADAPLRAILFLEKADTNRLVPMLDHKEVFHRLVTHVVKALVTPGWWDKTLALLLGLAQNVPAYRLQLDRSGQVKDVLRSLVENHG